MKNDGQRPHGIVLGAGPAGLGTAYKLAATGKADVTVLEQNQLVGGNAGSFEIAGIRVDYGSHRLHPACDPEILADIRTFLGEDLLDRPRHGRIRLRGRWIHFPLKPLDLLLKLPPRFGMGVAMDTAMKVIAPRNGHPTEETFATVLESGLGRTICQDFYFPYARKIWGMEPAALSAIQARRRVSAGSLGKMARKVLSAVPGLKPKGSGRFFYPRRGFGQISEAYHQAAVENGVQMKLGARVQSVVVDNAGRHSVEYEQEGVRHRLEGDFVWSTIPITVLARSLTPALPPSYLAAAASIRYRAMILIYLVLDQVQFTEYDAHYFPEAHIRITRLSEPKNYSNSSQTSQPTVICAELPCAPDDPEWTMDDQALGELVRNALKASGLPVTAPVREVMTRRLKQAYPVYPNGYEAHFDRLDEVIGQIDGLLSFGRQGLFAHDNTHHALHMGYSAVECLDASGAFDIDRWRQFREQFNSHVVED